jgi:hypothetical protein
MGRERLRKKDRVAVAPAGNQAIYVQRGVGSYSAKNKDKHASRVVRHKEDS